MLYNDLRCHEAINFQPQINSLPCGPVSLDNKSRANQKAEDF